MNITNDVLQRLNSFGVTVLASNDAMLQFAISRAEEMILNDINCSEIPFGLKYTFIDMASGCYLHDQKAMGLLDASVLDLTSAPAKQIKEGDVQITFATSSDGSLTPEARFDQLVQSLIHPDPVLLTRYRRLAW